MKHLNAQWWKLQEAKEAKVAQIQHTHVSSNLWREPAREGAGLGGFDQAFLSYDGILIWHRIGKEERGATFGRWTLAENC